MPFQMLILQFSIIGVTCSFLYSPILTTPHLSPKSTTPPTSSIPTINMPSVDTAIEKSSLQTPGKLSKLREGRSFGLNMLPYSVVQFLKNGGGEPLGLGKECEVDFEIGEYKGEQIILL